MTKNDHKYENLQYDMCLADNSRESNANVTISGVRIPGFSQTFSNKIETGYSSDYIHLCANNRGLIAGNNQADDFGEDVNSLLSKFKHKNIKLEGFSYGCFLLISSLNKLNPELIKKISQINLEVPCSRRNLWLSTLPKIDKFVKNIKDLKIEFPTITVKFAIRDPITGKDEARQTIKNLIMSGFPISKIKIEIEDSNNHSFNDYIDYNKIKFSLPEKNKKNDNDTKDSSGISSVNYVEEDKFRKEFIKESNDFHNNIINYSRNYLLHEKIVNFEREISDELGINLNAIIEFRELLAKWSNKSEFKDKSRDQNGHKAFIKQDSYQKELKKILSKYKIQNKDKLSKNKDDLDIFKEISAVMQQKIKEATNGKNVRYFRVANFMKKYEDKKSTNFLKCINKRLLENCEKEDKVDDFHLY